MRNTKTLLIEQLDKKLKPFKKTEMVIVPINGWINTIRTTLNMTMAQLGTRLKITRQGVKSIEESEAKGSISINSLKEIGKALDLKFVYGFVPNDGTIDKLIENLKSLLIHLDFHTRLLRILNLHKYPYLHHCQYLSHIQIVFHSHYWK